jgi:S-DNA-T family DNA segregation ATPase FtsK/SpoIIIE
VPWYLIDHASGAQSDPGEPEGTPDGCDTSTPEGALWLALCSAPDDGADVAELMRVTGMRRSTVYKYLAQLADQGRAIQVGWGRWRAADPADGHSE